MLVELLTWIVVGGVAGWLAGVVVKGTGFGLGGDVLVGIVGAILGGLIISLFGGAGFTGFNLWSLFVAFVGAVVILFVVRAVNGGRNVSV
jgi:uncharacterized membrane protein YeaQ/YmgE (transglycosylase-associated protein family)